MKNTKNLTLAALIVAALSMQGSALAQSNGGEARTTQTRARTSASATSSQSAADVVRAFFDAFGKGNVEGVLASFHENSTIVAVRKGERKGNQLHGSYSGKEGAKAFVANLGKNFDTKAFSVNHVVSEGNVAFASGSFVHTLKSTGKPYSSDWALMCVVKDGKILEYHFYEDSASFAEANKR